MHLLTARGQVALEDRIGIPCRTTALRYELSSKKELLGGLKLKAKDVQREGRAVRRLVGQSMSSSVRPVESHSTYRRVRQLAANGVPTNECAEEDRRVLEMFEWIKSAGIIPPVACHPLASPSLNSAQVNADFNIGVAVLNKHIYFYRTGHHRLAMALMLGIPVVPIDILFWDAAFNRLNVRERQLLFKNLE